MRYQMPPPSTIRTGCKVTLPTLLDLPNELLLRIFHQLTAVRDAFSLAGACSLLHNLFLQSRNRILRSAADIPCRPDYGISETFSGFTRTSPSSWMIQTDKQFPYIIDMRPDLDSSPSIWHFIISDHQHLAFRETLDAFLHHFREIDPHLLDFYGGGSMDILLAAARLQEGILRNSAAAPTDFSGDTTIIALALRCLLDFHIIDIINLSCYGGPMEHDLPDDGSPVDLFNGLGTDNPPLSAKGYKQTSDDQSAVPTSLDEDIPGCHFKSNPHTMLDTIIWLSFKLLDTGDPKHWPTVMYVLLILGLIQDSLFYCPMWMGRLYKASDILGRAFQGLAQYFYLSTEGGKILTYRWDKEDYVERVGHDHLAVEHACILHDLWFDGDEQVQWNKRKKYKGLKGFPTKLVEFADGEFRHSH
ncbi:uncharacterized protein BJX67DRAFT_342693 [Aspergillus lucknowensis]|uniref:F-box domain-containing protein n=1 Tax=Aspergillus lucknowensis TaxID=176173 RepID=A0ABR4M4S8_9EURO